LAVNLQFFWVQMELISHIEPIKASSCVVQPEVMILADAFSEFISASARLEASYAQLQMEVTHLSRELTDRNTALNASLAENERVHRALQQIVDSMPCGVLVVESGGAVLMINPEARRLLDLGMGVADDLECISSQAGIDLAGFLQRRTSADEEQEFSRSSASGRRWLAVHERSLVHEGASETDDRREAILILRDVTLHKQAEMERERARKTIALSEVATTLAHEIRNPLASLELFAGLIASGGEEAAEWISHLHAGIRSLAGTVNNVLSFHNAGLPALVELDLAQAIRSSVEFARPITEQAGVRLAFCTEGHSVKVMGNGGALQQVVLNLVCNAVRHTGAGGCVRVSVRRVCSERGEGAGRALLEFADTGCGIAAELLDEIFRAGFSGSGTTSGLGLAVCSQIVKQHDGTIRVESKLGRGTSFFVEIPTL
jgi:two-component system sensor histidine kinase FlrB